MYKNEGNQKVVYLSRIIERTSNGLYMIMAGITYPSSDYYITRDERSGIFWGGVYVFEYIRSGCGYIEADGEVFKVEQGDFIFMNAKRKITYYSDPNDPYEKIWVNFTGPLTAGIVNGLSLNKSVYVFKFDAEQTIKEMHSLLSGLNEVNREEAFDRLASHILKMLLIVNSNSLQKANIGDDLSTAERVKAYIDSLALPNITLDDIAAEFGLSKNYLIHSFKRRFALPPHQYLLKYKNECAKNMLLEKHMSIKEISLALGFSSTQHFSKSFKQITGISPGRYEIMFRNTDEIAR